MIIQETTPSILAQLLGATNSPGNEPSHPIDPDIAAVALRNARKHWDAPNEFTADDLVRVSRSSAIWKQGLGLGLVLRTYDTVDEPSQTSGVRYFHNMRILILHSNGATQELAVHSRDFEHAQV